MAPAKDSAEVLQLADKFQAVGLSADKAREAARNQTTAQSFDSFIEEQSLRDRACSNKQANLLLALSASPLDAQKRAIITAAVLDNKLLSSDQLQAAISYCSSNDSFHQSDFEQASGIGVTVSPEEVQRVADAYVKEHLAELQDQKWASVGKTLGSLKQHPDIRWASAQDVKTAVEASYTAHFGPKEDVAAAKKAKAKAANAQPKASSTKSKAAETTSESSVLDETRMFEEGWLARLYKPGENAQEDPKLMEQHLAFTKGKVFTRFPPEPNGYMHIGHLKALCINFGYAKFHGGHCYLRYDDTNPEAEEQVYIDAILDMVHWLGFEPFKITYASDYFERLFECAKDLIRRGKAYVDHSTAEEMKVQRGERKGARTASQWRDRPVEESLTEFQAMQDGKYQPGEAILRMKMDLDDPNPQMWDVVAYRVLKKPHHRTGTKWKIYPTYDFTHCLNDSFENVSHSLCTIEFITARQSYEWLCDALELYKPRQSEYGRLNIQGTITSKRKLRELVERNIVNDWDDPRLYTLAALRRRGVPPGALKSFISNLGTTTSNVTLALSRLEQAIRQYLEVTTPRLMLVLQPVKLTIENLADDYLEWVERPVHPRHPEQGSVKLPFTKTLYIEAEDFRETDSSDFFRLAPGKSVGLLNIPRPVTCLSCKKDDNGEVSEIICRYDAEGEFKKPKAYIQWVAEHADSKSPVRIDEARLFKPLFTTDDPGSSKDFLAEVNPDALEIARGPVADIGFWDVVKRGVEELKRERSAVDASAKHVYGNECVRFQGLRTAYFCLDQDSKIAALEDGSSTFALSKGDRIVLNTIVGLKEDTGKR